METRAVTTPSRHLPLDVSYNLRDVGGYATATGVRTRWRTLLRADALHRLTPDSQAELLRQGVRTVIDLRWPAECALAPNVFSASAAVRYLHLPVFGDPTATRRLPETLPETYRLMVDERREQLRATLAAMAAPGGLPAIVHCTAGKDRTGIVVGLALALAGVPAATIAEDYALSNDYLANGYYDEVRRRVLARGDSWERVKPLFHCAPEYMLQILAYLEGRHGSVEGYLLAIGLTPAELAALRAALIEPAAEAAS
jgi:protein-tyrosine phosphatase